MNASGYRVAILGGGPVGLEAAARAIREGYSPTLYEAEEVAAHIRDWGHVRLFTPLSMNVGPAGRALLGSRWKQPEADPLLSGRDFRDSYLLPLADAIAAHADVVLGSRVHSVSRGHHLKQEGIGSEGRAADPFRLLLERRGGERVRPADVVLDCTGSYGNPNWMGPGGAPAVGERALRNRIVYGIPDVLGTDRSRFAGRRTLLVGGGHSAATTATALAALAREEPDTRFLWLTRRPPGQLPRVPDDPLPERARLVDEANALAEDMPPGCRWIGSAQVEQILESEAALRVRWRSISREAGTRRAWKDPGPTPGEESADGGAFDIVVANVGYEPDDSLYRQLQVHECYATRGPMKLAAALLSTFTDGPADCLKVESFGPETLRNPEPMFFVLGMKSYGRTSTFLLRTGYEQVSTVFSLLRERLASRTGVCP